MGGFGIGGGLVGEEWGGSRYSMGGRDLGGPIVMKEGGWVSEGGMGECLVLLVWEGVWY